MQQTQAPKTLPRSAYARAEKLLPHYRPDLLHGSDVRPRWVGDGEEFWYRISTNEGQRFMRVSPEQGVRAAAFDHARVAEALAAASGQVVDADELPFTEIEIQSDRLSFSAFGEVWSCTADGEQCERVAPTRSPAGLLEVASPDGSLAAYRQGEDIWLRDLATNETRPLTTDGSPSWSYGSPLAALNFFHFLRNHGIRELPPLLLWSPDSRSILTHRLDERGIRPRVLVDALPPDGDRPQLYESPYAIPGEDVATAEWVVIDVDSSKAVLAEDSFPVPIVSPLAGREVWWTADSEGVFYLDHSRDRRTMWLKALDPQSGETSIIIEETGPTRVEAMQELGKLPNVYVLDGEQQALWYSQRDGWGHLYLYDLATGAELRQLTSGDFAVQEIVHVDERERCAFALVSGLVKDDPYRRSLVRIGLDSGELTPLHDDELDHAVIAPPHGRWFLDVASAVDTPPTTSVRDRTGALLLELESTNISALLDLGWSPPERVRAMAADGSTPIYGVLYKPFGFDATGSYPIIDHVYPGPFNQRVRPSFDSGYFACEAEALAALGFAVLAIDGRGTAGRDKAFHDFSYKNLGSCGLEDHVAALSQLAAERPWLDLDRVGIVGQSAGGFATVRALLTYPDVFHVGVAECGNHDNHLNHAGWAEAYDGPIEADSADRLSSIELADRLSGHLLLVHGGLDDNVDPNITMRLVDKLIVADKDFDLLIVPRAEHFFVGFQEYVIRKRWDFFVRHLMQLEPPKFGLAAVPPFPPAASQADLYNLMSS